MKIARMEFVVVAVALAGVCAGQPGQCPRMIPAEVRVFLPVAQVPGPYAYVREKAEVWVMCDSAATGGVPVQAMPSDSRLMAVVSEKARAPLDTTYQWPNLALTAMSTTVAPAAGSISAPVTVATFDGRSATLPVSVTFTAAPFIKSPETTLLFATAPSSLNDQDVTVWFPNAQTAMPFRVTAESSGWLSVAPADGAGYTKLRTHVDVTGVARGDYIGFIVITAAGAVNSPLRIPVRLVVATP